MSKREETRWERRERKYKKRRYGMRVSGRSIKGVLLHLIGRRAEEARRGEKPPLGKRKRRKKRR